MTTVTKSYGSSEINRFRPRLRRAYSGFFFVDFDPSMCSSAFGYGDKRSYIFYFFVSQCPAANVDRGETQSFYAHKLRFLSRTESLA